MTASGSPLRSLRAVPQAPNPLATRSRKSPGLVFLEAGKENIEQWPDLIELVKPRFSPLWLSPRVIEVEKSQYEFKPAA